MQIRFFINKIIALIILEGLLLSQGAYAGELFQKDPPQRIFVTQSTINRKNAALDRKTKQDVPQSRQIRAKVVPDQESVIELGQVKLTIPAGAVKKPIFITIACLDQVDPLNPGMCNVTSGSKGYRFLPSMNFEKELQVTLPFDREQIQSELDYTNLFTYFNAKHKGVWERLERVTIDRERGVITSRTNHFTDLINSTLSVPDSPAVASHNLNSIKQIKAAHPFANIPSIQGLSGSSEGRAGFKLPFTLPAGRSLTPHLFLSYQSEAGASIVGQGFDLPIPCIAVDTRFGVPRYDGNETYLLNGQELVQTGGAGSNIKFRTRVEGDFQRIVREGDRPGAYLFIVTSRDGTKYFYGHDEARLTYEDKGIYKWYLKKVEDVHGNHIEYTYFTEDGYTYPKYIDYTGHKNGLQPAYHIEFKYEERQDVMIDCRGKFISRLKKRVRKIRLRFQSQLIREYRFFYEYNDCRQSQLYKLAEYDRKDKEFYAYEFKYHSMPRKYDGYAGFSEPEAWNQAGAMQALSKSHTISGGGGSYAGIGLDFDISAGVSAGFQLDFSHDLGRLMDINGDGLPDQVGFLPGAAHVRLNTGSGFGPPVQFGGLNGLVNLNLQSNFDFATSGSFGPLKASTGASFAFTNGLSCLTDMNGDGYMDLAPALLPFYLAGTGKGFEQNNYTKIENQTVPDVDLKLDDVEHMSTMKSNFHLIDPVRKWRPYHGGRIRLTQKINKLDDGEKQSDGVRLNCYLDNTSLWQDMDNDPVFEEVVSDQELLKTSLFLKQGIQTEYQEQRELEVTRDNSLYFKVNSIKDIHNDRVQWQQQICYQEIRLLDDLKDNYQSNQDSSQPLKLYFFNGKEQIVKKDNNGYYLDHDRSTSSVHTAVLPDEQNIGALSAHGILIEKTETAQGTILKWLKQEGTDYYLIIRRDSALEHEKIKLPAVGLDFTNQNMTENNLVKNKLTLVETKQGVQKITHVEQLSEQAPSLIYHDDYQLLSRHLQADQKLILETHYKKTKAYYLNPLLDQAERNSLEKIIRQTKVKTLLPEIKAEFYEKEIKPLLDTEKKALFNHCYEYDEAGQSYRLKTDLAPYSKEDVKTLLYPCLAGKAADSYQPEILENKILPLLDAGDQALIKRYYQKAYRLKNGADPEAVKTVFKGYGLVKKKIKLYADLMLPVTQTAYQGRIKEQEVVCRHYEDPSHAEQTSFVELAGFDKKGVTHHQKLYLHVFDSRSDFNLTNLVNSGIDSKLKDQDKEHFQGGVYHWYYGQWNGDFTWDTALIKSVQETQQVPNRPNYDHFIPMQPRSKDFTYQAPHSGLTIKNKLKQDIWLGSEFSRKERAIDAALTKSEKELYFAGFIGQSVMNPGRIGGDSLDHLPAFQQKIDLGAVAGDVQTSFGFNANLSGGLSSLSASFTGGFTHALKDLIDLNGDHYPDQIIQPFGCPAPLVLLNNGGGFDKAVFFKNAYPLLRESLNRSMGIGVKPGAVGSTMKSFNAAIGKVKAAKPNRASRAMDNPGVEAGLNAGLGESIVTTDYRDINGDGLPDHIRCLGPDMMVRLNLGDRFSDPICWGKSIGQEIEESIMTSSFQIQTPDLISYSNTVHAGFNLSAGQSSAGASGAVSVSGSRTKADLLDINGDGLPDQVFKTHPFGHYSDQNNYFLVKLNQGDRFSEPIKWYSPANWQTNDGLVFDIDNYVENVINRVLQQVKQTNGNAPLDTGQISVDFDSLRLGEYVNDINIMGAGDVLSYSGSIGLSVGFNFTIEIGPLGPTPLFIFVTPEGNFAYSQSSAHLNLTDIDGDGLADHVFQYEADDYCRVKLNQAKKAGLLKKIKTPQGGAIHLEYEKSKNTVDLPHSRYLLTKVIREDGRGQSYSTAYDYEHGYYDREERLFYGFKNVKTRQADGTYTVHTYENRDYYEKGLLLQTESYGQNDRLLLKTEYAYQKALVDDKAVFPMLVEKKSFIYDHAGHRLVKAEQYGYDHYGNLVDCHDQGNLNYSQDDLYISLEYDYFKDKHIVNLPRQLTVTNRNGTILRQKSGTYNSKGSLIRQSQYLANGEDPITLLEYDSFGNVSRVTDPSGYSLDYEYDNITQSYVTKVTDSFGYTSSTEYDLCFGVPVKAVDLNRNEVCKKYDCRGRLEAVFTAYDESTPSVQFEYYPEQSPARAVTCNKVHFEAKDNTVLKTVVFSDGLGRIMQTVKQAETALADDATQTETGYTRSGRVIYDEMGRVKRQGQPFFTAGADSGYHEGELLLPTTFEYDDLGRTIKTILPDQSIMQTEYSIQNDYFKTTVIDANGKRKSSYLDLRENIVKLEQFNNNSSILTQYVYNELNEIIEVKDADNHVTYIQYDSLGRRISINNPDAGLIEYSYDQAGNLIAKKDNNLREAGKKIHYYYDYHRLSKIEYPDMPAVQYSYGPPNAGNNQAGRIVSVTNESGTKSFSYGKLGEQTGLSYTVNTLTSGYDPLTFTEQYEYDYLGRTRSITYADGEKLYYHYNHGGEVDQVYGLKSYHDGTEMRYDYVKKITYDQFGQRIYLQYGNGTDTHYSYDPKRRWLNNIETKNIKGKVFQDQDYTFDRVGNILAIENRGFLNTKQTYTYDDLYQLTGAKGTCTDTAHCGTDPVYTYSQRFTYDKIGNMKTKTSTRDVRPYNSSPNQLNYSLEYTYDSEHPHQLIDTGITKYCYDGNGNLTKRHNSDTSHNTEQVPIWGAYYDPIKQIDSIPIMDEEEITNVDMCLTWDSENRLKQVNNNSHDARYLYDSGGQRVLKRGNRTEIVYPTQFIQLDRAKKLYTKHIFVGTTRISSKLCSITNYFKDIEFEKRNNYTYHPDHQGSTSFVSDFRGEIYEYYQFTPYGEIWTEKSDILDKITHLFTSKELDVESGFYYFGARYLEPMTSRWLSCDPILGSYLDGKPAGGVFNPINLNLYHYCANSPLNYTDPTGLFSIENPYSSYMNNFLLDAWYLLANTANDAVHGALEGMGFFPVAGEFADGLNALIYAFQGEYGDAALSTAAMIPLIGDLAGKGGKVGKFFTKYGDELTQYLSKHTDDALQGIESFVRNKLGKNADEVIDAVNTAATKSSTIKSACFTEDTLIKTESGYEQIKDIEVGDVVYAKNVETGEQGLKEVVNTFVHNVNQIVHLTLEDGKKIRTTLEHPFWVVNQGWSEVRDLKKGDTLLLYSDKKIIIKNISIINLDNSIIVYNFEVTDWHTYYVTDLEILVHNKAKLRTLQTGGNTLEKSTLKKLGLSKQQGKYAIESLKKDLGLKNDFHQKIMINGDIVDSHTGITIGNLFDYLP